MKCCGSRTTSTARPADVEPVAASEQARAAARAFETLLLRTAFQPLAKPLGFFGDIAVDACARAVVNADASLVDRIAQLFVRATEAPAR
jgi:hypothetical protein